MNRCPLVALVLLASIVIYKYDGRGRPVYAVLRWRAYEELQRLAAGVPIAHAPV